MKSKLMSTTSDKTKIYNHKKASKIFQNLKTTKFSLQDMIMILLFAQDKPVHGRTLLIKELFLLYMRQLSDDAQNPKFVPYRLGPYSFHLMETVSTMNLNGYLQVKGRKNSNAESFSLTDKGKKNAKKVFNKLGKETKNSVIEKRKGWDQLGTDGILNYVYTHYPKYKKNSIFKKRYKDIIWGE